MSTVPDQVLQAEEKTQHATTGETSSEGSGDGEWETTDSNETETDEDVPANMRSPDLIVDPDDADDVWSPALTWALGAAINSLSNGALPSNTDDCPNIPDNAPPAPTSSQPGLPELAPNSEAAVSLWAPPQRSTTEQESVTSTTETLLQKMNTTTTPVANIAIDIEQEGRHVETVTLQGLEDGDAGAFLRSCLSKEEMQKLQEGMKQLLISMHNQDAKDDAAAGCGKQGQSDVPGGEPSLGGSPRSSSDPASGGSSEASGGSGNRGNCVWSGPYTMTGALPPKDTFGCNRRPHPAYESPPPLSPKSPRAQHPHTGFFARPLIFQPSDNTPKVDIPFELPDNNKRSRSNSMPRVCSVFFNIL